MKKIIVVLLVNIAAMSVAAGRSAKKMNPANPVEAIKQLEIDRNKALVAADIAAIDRLYAADYTSVVGNTYRSKAEVLADLKSGTLKLQASSNDETNVRVYGNTAVVTGKSTLKRRDRGTEINGQVYFTRVWVKQMGGWRLVANHASNVTP